MTTAISSAKTEVDEDLLDKSDALVARLDALELLIPKFSYYTTNTSNLTVPGGNIDR